MLKCKKCSKLIDESNIVLGTCVSCLARPRKQKTPNDIPYRYRKLKDRAKHKGMPFSLTLGSYKTKIEAGCSYCGCDIKKETGGGMDRIDNTEGYIESNVRASCGECNEIRGYTLTSAEMEAVAKALNEYRLEHGYTKPMSKEDVIKMKKEKGWK